MATKKTDQYYRIRNSKTSLFSKGGADAFHSSSGQWTKTGKVWKGLGPLKNHLNVVIESHKGIPDDWEVVEYQMVEVKAESAIKYVNLIRMLKASHRK